MPAELLNSNREEQNHATIDAMQEAIADRTPAEAQTMLDAGLDMMREDREKNSEFFTRMAGIAALRDTVQMAHSEEVHQVARQLHGVLGYDPAPRNTGDTQHSNEVYQVARQVYGPIGYDAGKARRSRNKL